MLPARAEIVIVGGGIVGLTVAQALLSAGHRDLLVLEKEEALGRHASGRNSGVLHAGVYYAPDSLRAKVCLAGNGLMREYCRARGLPLLEAGKVIVARSEAELPVLEELRRRATANGARVEAIDEAQLAELEPMARTAGKALLSRDTAAVDPKAVLEALRVDLAQGGVRVVTGCRFEGRAGPGAIRTSQGPIAFGRLVNAAGSWCDRVAGAFGAGRAYRLVPFKGIYRKLKAGAAFTVNGNIYPVPDIRNPFLGIHFSRSVHGDVYLGPTAIPALGRENYGLLAGAGWEAFSILATDAALFLRNPAFRSVALSEPKKYLATFFNRDAARLVRRYDPGLFEKASKVGIRPQLVERATGKLVMDFVVEARDGTVHLLNPISPAFTASMALARQVVAEHFTS